MADSFYGNRLEKVQLRKSQRSADTSSINIPTPGSPSSQPISARSIGTELEMAVLKKLKSNAEQQGAALVELINQSPSPAPVPGSPQLDVYA
jgi:hypothetical protein